MTRRKRCKEPAGPECFLHEESGADDFDTRVAAYLDQQVRPVVEELGFATQQITTNDHRQDFCYTIGLTDKGYPELLVQGFHPVISGAILQMVVAYIEANVAPEAVCASTRLMLPVGPDKAEVAFWLLAPTPEEDRDRGPGFAKAYYQRWVPHLVVKPAGWPCDRCTAEYDARTRCTCKFACSWHLCALQDGDVVLETAAATCNHEEGDHVH